MEGYSPEVADSCKLLKSLIVKLEKETIGTRLSNIRVAKKFQRFKRAAEEFIDSIRRL